MRMLTAGPLVASLREPPPLAGPLSPGLSSCASIYIIFLKVPAPRLSRTPAIANISEKEPEVGQHTIDILSQELEYTSEDIKALLEAGIIECSNNSSKL